MRKMIVSILISLALITSTLPAYAATRVKGYTTKKGTYIQPHYRSSSNSKKYDNYSSKGNYNPYTGKKGSKKQ